jgi:hypothetical protein
VGNKGEPALAERSGAFVRIRLSRAAQQLFQFGREETPGEAWRGRLFESFLLIYAVYWAWEWGLFIAQIPAVVVPQGIARELDISFLMGGRLGLANAAIITLCALSALFKRGARLSLPLLVALLHLQYVARHSLGKVAHGSQYVGIGLLMLAVAAWCMPSPGARRRFTLGATQFFMGAGYMCAALSKLIAKGPSWADGQHLWLWIGEKSVDQLSNLGHAELNALQRLCLEHRWLATAFLAGGLLTELSGFLLWSPKTRAGATLALIGLHLGVFWTMDILFDTYIYQLLLVGLPWPRWIDGARGRWLNGQRASAAT